MGKVTKLVFSLLGVLIALIVVAIIVLPLVIDPNDYKDEITAAVQDKTGRTLEIEGDLGLSVFPWLGLDIGPTRLSNAAGFSEPYMARMEAVQVRVKLLPLLKKEVEVATVKLAGLQLNLGKDADGRTNWADLVAEGEEKETPEQKDDSAGSGLESLEIGGIDITDARLVWDDRSSKTRYEIDELALTTGAVSPGKDFDLDLAFRVAASEPAIDGRLSLSGTVGFDEGLERIDISGMRLAFSGSGDGLPGGKADVTLATDIALDLQAQTLSLPQLVLSAWGLELTGNIAGSDIRGEVPQFSGRFDVASFAPRELIQQLGQPAPVTTDGSVLAKASAALDWNASTRHFAASQIKVQLDDTSVNGRLRVDSFDAPAISFQLAVDSFDLDRYVPPPAEGEAAPASAAGSDQAADFSALRKLNLKGDITVDALKAAGLSYSKAKLTVSAKNGVVHLYPIGAQLYGGSYNGDITLDVRKQTPQIAVNEKVSSVQAGPLLKDLIGDDKLLGTASLTAKFSGSGATPEALKRTVSGNASFSFTDGAVKGVNIAALIRDAQAKLKGQPVTAGNEPNQTDFAMLSGSAVVSNGLVRNDDLTLQSPLLRISGKGETSLPDETIDYLLTTKFVGSLEGQGGKGLEDLKGVSIPVRVGGTYSKPTYTPDVAVALKEVAQDKVEEKVQEKVEKKIKDKIGDQLGDQLLKGLFK